MPDVSKCNGCGQDDDHPKQHVYVPAVSAYGSDMPHPDDHDADGFVSYHLDCSPDHFAQHADPAHVAAAKSGTHGADLRALITEKVA